MTLIATDITSTRWLNPDYFRKHHPERMRKGLVHYVMWVVVDPDVELRGANIALAKEALAAEARDGALSCSICLRANNRVMKAVRQS